MRIIPFLAFLLLSSSIFAQSNLTIFKAEEGKKFDDLGTPGDPFKINDHVPTASNSSGIVAFFDAKVIGMKKCSVRVTVLNSMESARRVSVKGKKNRDKFYDLLKDELGTPTKLTETGGIYVYEWTDEEVGSGAVLRRTYQWNSHKKIATFTHQLLTVPSSS